VDHQYPDLRVHLYFMRCDLLRGEPQVLDCADLVWVRPEEFSQYKFPEADKGIIEGYIMRQKE